MSFETEGEAGAAVVEVILEGVLGLERFAKGEFGSEGGAWLETLLIGGGVDDRGITRRMALVGGCMEWRQSW